MLGSIRVCVHPRICGAVGSQPRLTLVIIIVIIDQLTGVTWTARRFPRLYGSHENMHGVIGVGYK